MVCLHKSGLFLTVTLTEREKTWKPRIDIDKTFTLPQKRSCAISQNLIDLLKYKMKQTYLIPVLAPISVSLLCRMFLYSRTVFDICIDIRLGNYIAFFELFASYFEYSLFKYNFVIYEQSILFVFNFCNDQWNRKINTPGKAIPPLTFTRWHLETIVPGKLYFCRCILTNFLHFMLQFQLWILTKKLWHI